MKKSHVLLVLLLVGMLLVGSMSNVSAQEGTPPSAKLPLVDMDEFSLPTREWTDKSLQRLADMIVTEAISVEQVAQIYDQLSEKQIERVTEIIGERAGVPLEETRSFLAKRKASTDQASCSGASSHAEFMAKGAVTQTASNYLWGCYKAEYVGPVAINLVQKSGYWLSTECGTQDTDWNLQFDLWYYQDPDRLRWYTTSSQVYWVFRVAYGLELNSFAYSYDPWWRAHLVVGQTAASLAGGIYFVMDNLWLGVNP